MDSDAESFDSSHSLPALELDCTGTSDEANKMPKHGRMYEDLITEEGEDTVIHHETRQTQNAGINLHKGVYGSLECDAESSDSSRRLPALELDCTGTIDEINKMSKQHGTATEDLITEEGKDKVIHHQLKQIQNAIINPRKRVDVPSLPDLKPEEVVLKPLLPAGNKFLDERKMYSLYNQESLQCKVPIRTTKRMHVENVLSKMSARQVFEHIKVELFQREYTRPKTANRLIQYMFHLMCCLDESDAELQISTYQTLIYLLQNNFHNFMNSLADDLIIVLRNYGATPHLVSKDENSVKGYSPARESFQSGQQQVEDGQETVYSIPEKNLSLMLQTISVVLQGPARPPECLDDIDIIVVNLLALSMDPHVLKMNHIPLHIMACVGHAFELYPESVFKKRMQLLVQVVYDEVNNETYHNIAYISQYLPHTKRGQSFFASLAYVALQHLLDLPKFAVMDIVEVEDIKDLILKNKNIIEEKFSYYQLHSFLRLMVCCIGHKPLGPFDSGKKQCLEKVHEMVVDILNCQRFKEGGVPSTRLLSFAKQVLSKWKYIANPDAWKASYGYKV